MILTEDEIIQKYGKICPSHVIEIQYYHMLMNGLV